MLRPFPGKNAMRPLAVPALLLLLAATAGALERSTRLHVAWRGSIPEARESADGDPPKPLLVYVHLTAPTRDQRRFEEVVLANESALLAMKFFETVKMSEERAKGHPLLEGVRFQAPAVVVFDSTREKRAVADGRASAMKIYSLLCSVGQVDYKTSVGKTVRDARNLLATFDQIDAARDSLGIKKSRLAETQADGKAARARKLEQEIAADQAEIDAMLAKAEKRWDEIWTLTRKTRD
jgi:hypothetical protein